MLKIAATDEERRGNLLMMWWNGHGAARILAQGENAILMERAEDDASLADVARKRGDDEASRMICSVLAKLHAPRDRPPPVLRPLTQWFEALGRAAEAKGGIFHIAATTASNLLASERDIVVLHGDMHHGNVLNFGSRRWLAIDSKCLVVGRYFDYANIFCNPDPETATLPGRLVRQLRGVGDSAHPERHPPL